MTLSAIVDRSPDAIGQAMSGNLDTGSFDPEALSSVRQYTDWEECLEKESLDLAYICVHTSKHYEMSMKALRKGLHVFIEKPFVLDVAEGEALIEEARRQQRKIGVAHVVRFMPAYVRLMELYRPFGPPIRRRVKSPEASTNHPPLFPAGVGGQCFDDGCAVDRALPPGAPDVFSRSVGEPV